MTLHAVPNQHLHLFPIFYILWLPPTIQNILLKLLQLNLCWEGAQSCKYIQILTDPFSVSSKPFMWVDLLFGNYLILLKAPQPSTTSLKESSVKISFRNSFPYYTSKLCAWTSLEGAFVDKENSRPITSWHVTLPGPQNIVNYKVSRIAVRFCYHYSKTNRNLPTVMQKPITHQHV